MSDPGQLARIRRLVAKSTEVRRRLGIGWPDLWREYRRFREAIGAEPTEFLAYDLYDIHRPVAERMAFICNRERRAIEYLMNPREANLDIRHKARATARLEQAGIPVGEVVGMVTVHAGVPRPDTTHPWWAGEAAVRELLRAAPAEGIVIKPDTGGGGRSVHVFRAAGPDGLVALDHTPWSVARLLEVLATEQLWKVERRVVQHPTLAAIAGETLGTVRAVTFRMLDGSVHLAPTVWKVPDGLSGLDHFQHGAGSYAAEIDPDTAILSPARKWHGLVRHATHPTTGQRIAGTVMPHWPALRDVAIRVAECFPALASLGLDIAVTADGPVVIEVNPCWGERPNQVGPMRGLVQGRFLAFLEERGYGSVMNLAVRHRLPVAATTTPEPLRA